MTPGAPPTRCDALAGTDEPDPAGLAAPDLLAEGPLTARQLGARLAERLSDSTSTALAMLVRTVIPVVQVTPRRSWESQHQPTSLIPESHGEIIWF